MDASPKTSVNSGFFGLSGFLLACFFMHAYFEQTCQYPVSERAGMGRAWCG